MDHPSLPLRQHIRTAVVTLAALACLMAGLAVSLWLASFIFYASLRMNPLHAGVWGWFDAVLMWRDGMMPNVGRKLVGAALFAVLVSAGGPVVGFHALWASSHRRRLYGSARFANESEIRQAGLL
ncbi:hypothetical protein ABWH74_001446 [Burkholderia vietnamiensis]|uniref:Conjugal transfer protein TraG n=2 Tax=Burkholderia vietnamiensis TaxID=60552 RepID=A4JR21_BURVG|nr:MULTISPECIES: hypothetical protein [Burkholderia cepacia complex]ABO58724.1 conserved hypothetical protein [Burkholderia vietnamiensis G4]AVR14580.1 hypothetical protein A8H33_14020 [Burkholderia vietnamiensis]MBJ9687269.1 hypothetical protein [Burkholderia vietnamiensis]MBR8005884.1 hypothetical protein [Burkholderia vietnamiensis]MBR8034414.1 hypothetical protein [Burkholderia vietnamiensis]